MESPLIQAVLEAQMKPLASFLNGSKKLLLIGGKGGVGKTTVSSSTALLLSQLYPGKKILLLSLDPAHSLADSLGQDVKGEPVKILKNLWAQEVDSLTLYREFIEQNKNYFKTLASRGTYFDDKDMEGFFELSIPGMDEVMGILYLSKLLQEQIYDILVVDTAPTGHTLRLLSLPYVMSRWIEVFELMQEKHHLMKARFGGKDSQDEADEFLEKTNEKLAFFENILMDPNQAEFVCVTLAEPMALEETQRLLQKLNEYKVPVRNMVINRLVFPNQCGYCSRRRKVQNGYFKQYESSWNKFNLIKIPLFSHEIHGLPGLSHFEEKLISAESNNPGGPPVEHPLNWPVAGVGAAQMKWTSLLEEKTKFIILGGKGGVGKTTMAAAGALSLANRYPNKKILIFSTDPAHSLSDSFGETIGNCETQIKSYKNLYALEMDAEALLEQFKKTYREDVENLFQNLLGDNFDLTYDRQVMESLIDLCPPGVDELMALNQMLKLEKEKKYDVFILDSAPTGHLLRLLQTPDIVRDWLKAIFELLLKYKGVIKLGNLAKRLIELSKDLRQLKTILTDKEQTKFIAVTIAESMGVLETKDLLSSLKDLKMNLSQIIINNIVPDSSCPLCNGKHKEQREYIKKIKKLSPWLCPIAEIPQYPVSIQGEELLKFSDELFF